MRSSWILFLVFLIGTSSVNAFESQLTAPNLLGDSSEWNTDEWLAEDVPAVPNDYATFTPEEIEEFLEVVKVDRRLLSEIRKEIPTDRKEAALYLMRLKKLSSQSDPVRLVPLVNRVISNSTIYYEWLEEEFETEEDRIMEYYIGGARGFHFALEEFRTAVLFTIINRLEITERIVNELLKG